MGIILIDKAGRRHDLTGDGPWQIGRQRGIDVQYPDDAYCARLQCVIAIERGAAVVTPTSERSPTFVDGHALSGPARLTVGSRIQFGQTELRIEHDRADIDPARPGDGDRPPVPAGTAIVIGREPGPDGIRLDHPAVSRRHARFHGGAAPTIEDLGSTNGTFVNGTRIGGLRPLAEGDGIAIGPLR